MPPKKRIAKKRKLTTEQKETDEQDVIIPEEVPPKRRRTRSFTKQEEQKKGTKGSEKVTRTEEQKLSSADERKLLEEAKKLAQEKSPEVIRKALQLQEEEEKEKEEKKKEHESPLEGKPVRRAVSKRTRGRKKEATNSTKEDNVIIERGHIYFFYRPKVQRKEVTEYEDVQRLYIILKPEPTKNQNEKEVKSRLIIIGRKKLPEPELHSKFWGFVDIVSPNIEDITKQLDEKHYETKTRGDREIGGARPVAEGIYAIVERHGHTHIAYVIEIPQEMMEVQEAFNIKKEGSYIISVKNPESTSPPASGLREGSKAKLPEELQALFEGRKFHSANPTSFLDHGHTEILLIAAYDRVAPLGRAGEELKLMEEKEFDEVEMLQDEKLFRELRMSKEHHPEDALTKGKWV